MTRGPFTVPDWPIFHQPWWVLLVLTGLVVVPGLFDHYHGRRPR